MALADYNGFTQSNFSVVALFDADKSKIGEKVGNIEIYDIKKFDEVVKKEKIDLIVIAVPAQHALGVLEQAEKAGIKAVLNFAPTPLKADGQTKLKTVDLTISLESLSYFLTQPASATATNGSAKSVKAANGRQRNKIDKVLVKGSKR
jgi:redox-sensing transcriptional repressor